MVRGKKAFLDLELCQLGKVYLVQLTNYNKILNQRNKLLRDLAFSPELMSTLEVWDEQLLSYGSEIITAREEFVAQLNEIIKEIHRNLTGEREKLELIYEPNVERRREDFAAVLRKNREKDIRFKMSSVGPHRDDLCVKVNGIDIRKFGSQGQQRTAALSLKLSEIYLVKRMIHDTPVLLLDDVLSELDSSRQNYLLKSIKEIQTLITCTGLDDFVNHQFRINRFFESLTAGCFRIIRRSSMSTNTEQIRFRYWKDWRRSESVQVCILEVRPPGAFIIWFMRL